NELLAALDAPPLDHDEVVRMVGEGARLLVSRVLAAGGVRADIETAFARFSAIYDRRLADHTRPYPGVVEGLERLAERVHPARPARSAALLRAGAGRRPHARAQAGPDRALGVDRRRRRGAGRGAAGRRF